MSFVWGCSTDVNTCLIPTSVHSFPNCWLANWVPLSEIRRLGTPKRHTMFFQTKCCTLCAVICATGSASIHLVKYSMATIKYFICLIANGNRPKISIPQVWKGHALYMDLSSSGGALCQSACIWHCLHCWAYRTQSSLTVGQKNPARITCWTKWCSMFWRIQILWRMLKPLLCLMLLCWFKFCSGVVYML